MIPQIIFIVPYRDRKEHKCFFDKYMEFILEDVKDYEIFFSHQKDTRCFNRGAVKNLGFIAMKEKYPDDYKNITFVFHDIDCLPYTKNLLNYKTKENVVKHFYGFEFVLGGIVSILGSDFEKINGFPNFWSYGFEDNVLQHRVLKAHMKIDRSNFFKIGDKNILHLIDNPIRNIDLAQANGLEFEHIPNGISTLYNHTFTINNEMIHHTKFDVKPYSNKRKETQVDLRKTTGNQIIEMRRKNMVSRRRRNPTMSLLINL